MQRTKTIAIDEIFKNLTPELKAEILSKLPIAELERLKISSGDNEVWRIKFDRHFPHHYQAAVKNHDGLPDYWHGAFKKCYGFDYSSDDRKPWDLSIRKSFSLIKETNGYEDINDLNEIQSKIPQDVLFFRDQSQRSLCDWMIKRKGKQLAKLFYDREAQVLPPHMPLLHWAIICHQPIKDLVKSNPQDINQKSYQLAVQSGQLETLQILLENTKEVVFIDHMALLNLAVKAQQIEILTYLLNLKEFTKNINSNFLFENALWFGNLEIFQKIYDYLFTSSHPDYDYEKWSSFFIIHFIDYQHNYIFENFLFCEEKRNKTTYKSIGCKELYDLMYSNAVERKQYGFIKQLSEVDLLDKISDTMPVDLIETLLKLYFDKNNSTEKNCYPLHYAIQLEKQNIVEVLLKKKYGIEKGRSGFKNDEGETPLHVAVRVGHLPSVHCLLDRLGAYLCYGVDPFSLNHAQQNAFDIAAQAGHYEILLFLLNRTDSSKFMPRDETGKTRLDYLVESIITGFPKMDNTAYRDQCFELIYAYATKEKAYGPIKQLFENKIFAVQSIRINKKSSLYDAVMQDDAELVKILVEHQANLQFADGQTAFMLALTENKNKALTVLSASVPKEQINDELLWSVIEKNISEALRALLSTKQLSQEQIINLINKLNDQYKEDYIHSFNVLLDFIDINVLISQSTILTATISRSHWLFLNSLFSQKNIDVNVDLLDLISMQMPINLIETFLRLHFYKFKSPQVAFYPLHYAIQLNKKNIIEALVDKRPDLIDSKDDNGEIPLLIAARVGDADSLNALMCAGSNPLVQNRNGQISLDFAAWEKLNYGEFTPLGLVMLSGHKKIIQAIRKYSIQNYIDDLDARQKVGKEYLSSFTFFGETIGFGYSATEKRAAAEFLLKAIEEDEIDVDEFLQHEGALKDGKLAILFEEFKKFTYLGNFVAQNKRLPRDDESYSEYILKPKSRNTMYR